MSAIHKSIDNPTILLDRSYTQAKLIPLVTYFTHIRFISRETGRR